MSHATIMEDFRGYLMADPILSSILGERIAQEYVDGSDELPYLLYGRNGVTEDLNLDGSGGIATTRVDVEARAADLATAESISNRIRRLFHGQSNFQMQTTEVQVADVVDQDEDALAWPAGNDERETSSAIQLEIMHTVTDEEV